MIPSNFGVVIDINDNVHIGSDFKVYDVYYQELQLMGNVSLIRFLKGLIFMSEPNLTLDDGFLTNISVSDQEQNLVKITFENGNQTIKFHFPYSIINTLLTTISSTEHSQILNCIRECKELFTKLFSSDVCLATSKRSWRNRVCGQEDPQLVEALDCVLDDSSELEFESIESYYSYYEGSIDDEIEDRSTKPKQLMRRNYLPSYRLRFNGGPWEWYAKPADKYVPAVISDPSTVDESDDSEGSLKEKVKQLSWAAWRQRMAATCQRDGLSSTSEELVHGDIDNSDRESLSSLHNPTAMFSTNSKT